MNANQLIEQLRVYGLDESEDYGHIVVLVDCWTGVVLSSVFHPEDHGSNRSITIIVGASTIEAAQGKLLAGCTPTEVGEGWESWLEVAERAMPKATMVAVSYICQFYEQIGFNMEAFVNGPGKDMSNDERQEHLNRRLEYAVSRYYINKAAELALGIEDADKRATAVANFDVAYQMLDASEAVLAKVDGQ